MNIRSTILLALLTVLCFCAHAQVKTTKQYVANDTLIFKVSNSAEQLQLFTDTTVQMESKEKQRVEITQMELDESTDRILLHYNYNGKRPASINFVVRDSSHLLIPMTVLSGEVGHGIEPGLQKKIILDLNTDSMFVYNQWLTGYLMASISKTKVSKDRWIPWWYIAAGTFTIGGRLLKIHANALYNDYQTSMNTMEAEQLHRDAEFYDNVSLAAFSSAALCAVVGFVCHIKHKKQQKTLSLSYIPQESGGEIAIDYRF